MKTLVKGERETYDPFLLLKPLYFKALNPFLLLCDPQFFGQNLGS